MKAIIKAENINCEHEKPHKKATLRYFQVWEERVCSINYFDKKFGKNEGLWRSKGKNHKETSCKESGCYCEEEKHCRRQLPSKKFWSIDFKTLKDFEKFVKENGYLKIFIEDQDGCGITIEI